jgi:hypothetical protein
MRRNSSVACICVKNLNALGASAAGMIGEGKAGTCAAP